MSQTNRQIVEEILAAVPPGYYGQIELHFSNGLILYTKTTSTKKYNTESDATGALNGHNRYK